MYLLLAMVVISKDNNEKVNTVVPAEEIGFSICG
jgi:hypothetical protein